jgi:protein phosphatase PTC2/3
LRSSGIRYATSRVWVADAELTWDPAEFRGPGVHHNFDDSDSGYDVDMDKQSKPFGIGGYKGRIIFLGDGTEVLTDSDDTEMFDNAEEDKDLASQVSKSSSGEEGEDNSGLPPRAPSPPPREKKSNTTSESKTETATSDTPTDEAQTEPKKEESKTEDKSETKE